MYISVCVCVCAHTRVHAHMYICMYVCIYVCMYVCKYIRICVCVCVYTCACVHMYLCMYVYMYVCTYVHMCVGVNTRQNITFTKFHQTYHYIKKESTQLAQFNTLPQSIKNLSDNPNFLNQPSFLGLCRWLL
jgi:nuclear pore complex protein Nup62